MMRPPVHNAGEFDVVVCGGGPSGLVAAVSAARCGCRTALVERQGFLGGTATGGLVVPISGFFHKGTQVVGGIAWEIVQRLEAMGAAQVEYPKGHVSVHPEYLKLAAQRIAVESKVALFTNSYLCGCTAENGRISQIHIAGKSGMEYIRGKCFIDATGDADLCALVGVPLQPDMGEMQPLSLCFLLENVDVSTPLLRDCIHHNGKNGAPSCNAVIRDYLLQCVQEGKIAQFGGPWFNSLIKGNTLAVNVTRAAADAVNRAEFTAAEMQLREDMFTVVELLRQRFPEFRNCSIVSSGINAGVRESRRVLGLETITGLDLLAGKMPECPAARCAHPMDIHNACNSHQVLKQLDAPAYVPHTALIPVGTENLLVTGRCISADRDAIATIRVQATVMSLGEAAGIMAAMSAIKHCTVSRIPVSDLKSQFGNRQFVL